MSDENNNKYDSDYCINCNIPILYPDKPCPRCGFENKSSIKPGRKTTKKSESAEGSGIKELFSYVVKHINNFKITIINFFKWLIKKLPKPKPNPSKRSDVQTNNISHMEIKENNSQKEQETEIKRQAYDHHPDTELLLIYNEKKKKLLVAYLFFFIAGIFGVHHLYIGNPKNFFAYYLLPILAVIASENFLMVLFLASAFVGILWLIDLINMQNHVENKNLKILEEVKKNLNENYFYSSKTPIRN